MLMGTVIKKYYLFPFIGFLIVLSIRFIGIKLPSSLQENSIILLIGSLFLSLLIGTLNYLQDTKWGLKKGKRDFQKLRSNNY